MSNDLYRVIPDALRPSAIDELTLDSAIDGIREAFKLRHDFHATAPVASHQRRLTPQALESGFAKARTASPPSSKEIADRYTAVKRAIRQRIFTLQNYELMQFILRGSTCCFQTSAFATDRRRCLRCCEHCASTAPIS